MLGRLETDGASEVHDFLFVGKGGVSVQVTDEQGDPFAGALVDVENIGGSFGRFTVEPIQLAGVTDAAGSFSFTDVPLGACQVVVRDPQNELVIGFAGPDEPDNCVLKEHGNVLNLDVATAPPVIAADGIALGRDPLRLPTRSERTLFVVLGSEAGPSGEVISLESLAPTLVSVPPDVTVPAGAQSASFQVQSMTDTGMTTIRAFAPGRSDGTTDVTVDPRVMTLSAEELSLGVGETLVATLTLSDNAPAGGVNVTFESLDPDQAGIQPSDAFISEGDTSVSAAISVNGLQPGDATLRATASGFADADLTIVVLPILSSESDTLTVVPGRTLEIPINLVPDDAPAGGVRVTLESTNPSVIAIENADPATGTGEILIAAGTREGTAIVRSLVPTLDPVTIMATAPGYVETTTDVIATADLDFDPPQLDFKAGFPPPPIRLRLVDEQGGTSVPFDVPITLQTTNPCITLEPAAPTIPANIVGVDIAIDHDGVTPLGASGCSTTVTATAANFTLGSIVVAVTDRPAITASPAAIELGAGLQGVTSGFDFGSVGLEEANHGGVQLTIESGNDAFLRVAPTQNDVGATSLTRDLANGITSTFFYVQAMEGAVGETVDIHIRESDPSVPPDPNFEARFRPGIITVNIVQPAIRVVTFPPGGGSLAQAHLLESNSTLAPDDEFVVDVGIANDDNSSLELSQAVRPGGSALAVTITNESLTPGVSVAELVQELSGTVQVTEPALVNIQPGERRSPTTLAAGGVALSPENPGQTRVVATIPEFISVPDGGVTVDISAPNLNLNLRSIGEGLEKLFQIDASTVSLDAAVASATSVALSLPDTSVATIAGSAAGPFGATATVEINAGATSVEFFVRGIAAGVAPISAVAAGFNRADGDLTIATRTYRLFECNGTPLTCFAGRLPNQFTTLDGPRDFTVQVGIGDGFNFRQQAVRTDFVGEIMVDVTSTPVGTTDEIGRLITSVAQGATVSVNIGAGASESPLGLGAGGVQIEPLAAGTTVVTASDGIGGSNAVDILVAQPELSMTNGGGSLGGIFFTIGAGLQSGLDPVDLPVVRLERTVTQETTVRVRSPEPGTVLVSLDGSAPADVVDVPIAAGETLGEFFLHGVTPSAPNEVLLEVSDVSPSPIFAPTTVRVTIVEPTVEIFGLADTITTLSPWDPFGVRVGVGSPGSVRVQLASSPIDVTITNEDPVAGQLRIPMPGGDDVAQSQMLIVGAGQGETASDAIVFQPLADQPEPTTVTPTADGVGFSFISGGVDVNVSTPDVVVGRFATTSRDFTVGSGLRWHGSRGHAVLEGSAHNGVTVTVRSLNAAIALVFPVAGTVGTECVTSIPVTTVGVGCFEVELAAGETIVDFTVDGVEGATTSEEIEIEVSALGHNPGRVPATVKPTALRIDGLATAATAGALEDPFAVTVGVINDNSNFDEQAVRPGGSGLTVNVSNTSIVGINVGELESTLPLNPDGSVDVAVLPGDTSTPAGNLAFRPLNAGSASIEATTAGPNSALVIVTVTDP